MPSLNMGQFKQSTVFVDQDGFLTFNPKSETGEKNSQVGFIHGVSYSTNQFSTFSPVDSIYLDFNLIITSPVSIYNDLSDEPSMGTYEGITTEAEYQKQKITKKVVKLSELSGLSKLNNIVKNPKKEILHKENDVDSEVLKPKIHAFLDLDD